MRHLRKRIIFLVKYFLLWDFDNQFTIVKVSIVAFTEEKLPTDISFTGSEKSVALRGKKVLHADENIGLRGCCILDVCISRKVGTEFKDGVVSTRFGVFLVFAVPTAITIEGSLVCLIVDNDDRLVSHQFFYF